MHFFPPPYRGTGFQANLSIEIPGEPYHSHSLSSLTRTGGKRKKETVSDSYGIRWHLYNRRSFSSALKSCTCAFSSWWGGRREGVFFIHFICKVSQKHRVSMCSPILFTPMFFHLVKVMGLQSFQHLKMISHS